jgi:hypothetical protein
MPAVKFGHFQPLGKPKPLAVSKPKGFTPLPSNDSMLGSRAMKSPEDYETGEGVAGLGKVASPYYQQQYASKGQSLKYDTATNTFK